MLEREIERRMRDAVRERGGLFYKFVSPGNTGVPDRIIVAPGRVVFVELKAARGRLSAAQARQIERLERQGAQVFVVRGPREAMALVDALFPQN